MVCCLSLEIGTGKEKVPMWKLSTVLAWSHFRNDPPQGFVWSINLQPSKVERNTKVFAGDYICKYLQ